MAINVLNRPDLAESHPTTASRVQDRPLIEGAVSGFTTAHTAEEVVEICSRGEVPCGRINSIADIFADPQFDARGTLSRIQHALLGEVVIPDVLPKLSASPGKVDNLGPRLGDWNTEIYQKRLGLTKNELELFEKDGVF